MREPQLILGNQFRRIRNIFVPLTKPVLLKTTFLFLFVLAFEVGIYFFFNRVFGYLVAEEAFNEFFVLFLVERLMGMVFLIAFSMLIFSNILSTLSVVYLSKDLSLLFSSPLNIKGIFISKYIISATVSSYTVLLIMLPVFISYSVVFHTGPVFILLAVFILLLFFIFSSGLGSLITMLLMRYFPAKKTYQVVTVLGILMIIVLVSVVRLMKPERLLNPKGGDDFAKLVESITVSSVGYFPGTWASKAVMGAGRRDFAGFFNSILPLVIAVVFVTLIVLMVAGKIYYKSWAMARISRRGGVRKRYNNTGTNLEKLFGFLPAKIKPLFVKDTLVFFRDTSQWSQIFILAGLVFIYVLNIESLPLHSAALKSIGARGVVAYLNIAFMGFIIATVVARFGFPAVSFEARSVWIVRSLPIRYRRYLWTKFLMFFLPLLLMMLVLLYVSNQILGIPPFLNYMTLTAMFFIIFGLTGLGVGLGAAYPRFDYENAAQVITGLGGLIFMVLSLVYIGLVVILLAVPGYYYFSYMRFGRIAGVMPMVVSIAVFLVLSLLIGVLPMEFGLKRWRKMQF